MSGDVIRGPWGWAPVKQADRVQLDRWCERLPNGRLQVLTDTGWHLAPIPPAKLTGPLPDRSPNRDRITVALDLRRMYGPEVDEALGVADAFDTVVDGWEDGTVVPTHDDIRRLAHLTGMLPAWFYAGTLPVMGHAFHCRGHQ
jgi:hypothetical protein